MAAMIAYLTNALHFPLLLFELTTSAILFSPDAFNRAATSAEARAAALAIAFLAGISEMLGQCVILVVNRVPLYRFIASLCYTGASYLVTALAWGLCAVAVAPLTRAGALVDHNALAVVGVVSLAFAPRLLGVFSIAPYFGVAFGNFLEAAAMALAIFGLHAAIDLPLGAAVFCGGVGWLASYGARSFLSSTLNEPLRRLRVLVSGSALERTPQQIADDIARAVSKRIES